MKLYHGSHIQVPSPQILAAGRIGDFGLGFYTTSSFEQARRWAQIRARQEETVSGYVTVFEVEENLFRASELRIKKFTKAGPKWLDFVMANRKNPDFQHGFDIVIGPVANDRVYTCLNAFEAGFMDQETVLANLKTFVLADQILFHTLKSLSYLTFHSVEEVPCSRK